MQSSFSLRNGATLGALAVLCAATIIAARAEQSVPGLTGIDHAADVVQARQLLMSQIDEEMQPVDLAAGGKEFPLDELKSNAKIGRAHV